MISNITYPLYSRIASLLIAIENCKKSGNAGWELNHFQNLIELVHNFMPSGSGIDAGTKINTEDSSPNRLVFHISFHHMNESGYYDGWTEHDVIVTPSLLNQFDLRITGRDRNSIKEYLHEVFRDALQTVVDNEHREVRPAKLAQALADAESVQG